MFATVSCKIYIIVYINIYIYLIIYFLFPQFSVRSVRSVNFPRERIEPAAKPACRVRSTDSFVAPQ